MRRDFLLEAPCGKGDEQSREEKAQECFALFCLEMTDVYFIYQLSIYLSSSNLPSIHLSLTIRTLVYTTLLDD